MNPKAAIEKYIITELGLTSSQMLDVFDKITKYEDIMTEFSIWLEHRSYDFDQPVVVEGYSAKDIFELNHDFDGIGVYNFLITLREQPEIAKKYIKEGFISL